MRLKKYVGQAHPNIYACIKQLQKEEMTTHFKYKQALKGHRAPARRRVDLNRELILNTYKSLLSSKQITLETYIERVINEYDFDALDKKNNLERSNSIEEIPDAIENEITNESGATNQIDLDLSDDLIEEEFEVESIANLRIDNTYDSNNFTNNNIYTNINYDQPNIIYENEKSYYSL